MEVRAAVPGDDVGLATVHVRSWQAAYAGQLPEEYLAGLSIERRAEWWRTTLARCAGAGAGSGAGAPGEGVLVAVDAEGIVGFLHYCRSRDQDAPRTTGEITSIYLLPGWWDRGVGRRLLSAGLDGLRDAGFDTATLWVLESNLRARRFYVAAGMKTDGATKDDVRPDFVLREVRYTVRLGR
jgi:ribosomal protein S18 acetylase RimI-like enzyme